MMTVGIRELKNRLSEFLRLVRGGTRILVTDRGEVVAELCPPRAGDDEQRPPGLDELARTVGARIGATNDPTLYAHRPVRSPSETARQLLDADRGER